MARALSMASLLSMLVAVVPRKKETMWGRMPCFCICLFVSVVCCGDCGLSFSEAPWAGVTFPVEGGLARELGGGGRGARFVSPMRKRVSVSWAFVGIPRRSVLGVCN